MIDLHIHTTFSDGSDDLEEVINKIYNAGIKLFSITDHDTALSARTILSIEELQNKIKNYGLSYVTGTEWTCEFLSYPVHIISYDFNPFAKEVLDFENELKSMLKEKNDFRLEYLRKNGHVLSQKSMDYLNSRINIRKLDIANCLVEDGYFQNVQDAISGCLTGIKYPKKYKLDGERVLKTLSGIGAKMVWAHSIHGLGKKPISYKEIDYLVSKMKECGLQGLECYYSLYNKQEINELIKIAKKYNLFITSGSDYHGKNKTVSLAEVSSDKTVPTEKEIATIAKIIKM